MGGFLPSSALDCSLCYPVALAKPLEHIAEDMTELIGTLLRSEAVAALRPRSAQVPGVRAKVSREG